MNFKKLISELKRRNVFKVATAYIIAGWLIIQVISTIAPQLHLPGWVPTFFTILVLTGFPIAIILAWAFEMTPEGVKRTDEVPKEQSITRATGKKLNYALITVLALAVVVLSYKVFFGEQTPAATNKQVGQQPTDSLSAPAKSIAVLPFENLSTDSSNAYFADGMQDMILTKLADIGDLKVISRTSTEQYKSHPGDLKTIAAQLGVATILEGSVQKAGSQVLINVQLINAQSDNHIWAESYQRTLNNIFGVEGEVAEKIASALNAKLSPTESKAVASVPTHNPAAYDAYLRGLALEANTSTYSTLGKLDSAYSSAVKLDPGFALAWAHLSSIDSFIYFFNLDETFLAKAKAALDRALALAPDAIATQIAAGDYYDHGLRQYNKALTAYHRVLQISPNNTEALYRIGLVERPLGHWQTALDYMNRALALDPRDVSFLSETQDTYWAMRRYGEAERIAKRVLAINPNDFSMNGNLVMLYQSEGKLNLAATLIAKGKITGGNGFIIDIVVEQALLRRNYTKAIRLAHEALSNKNLPKWSAGLYYIYLGFAEQLAGNRQATRRAYHQAIAAFKQFGEEPHKYSMLALAEAGFGEKTAALADARHAVALRPISRDAEHGPQYEEILAIVQARVGDSAQAIATIKRLMDIPGPINPSLGRVTPALLRLDPVWDPLRKDPAFQALLKKYPWKQG